MQMTVDRKVVILGAGKFGRRAAAAFTGEGRRLEVVVVDLHPPVNLPAAVLRVQAEAVEWLVTHFSSMQDDTILVPALPLHLAADWLIAHGAGKGLTILAAPLGDDLLGSMPNAFRLRSNQAASSHAHFRCPDDCSEPETVCTVTGQERPRPLYLLLKDLLNPSFVPHILRSRQYAPGVGGYEVGDLRRLYLKVRNSAPRQMAIATACKCHGIIDTFTVI